MQQNPNLTPQQKNVLFNKGTEVPFTGKYLNHHGDGIFTCANCGAELFDAQTKFDSGTGWPSFSDVKKNDTVQLVEDSSNDMHRTEVICKNCGGHLGHVFEDGPGPTGKRYCINSCSLDFEKSKT